MSLHKNNSKMITIKSRGYVTTSRGRMATPIRTPYRESHSRIWAMITQDRAEVYERLRNGEDIRLDAQNYDTDNNKTPEEKVENETRAGKNPDQTGNPVDAVQKAEEKDQNPAPQGNNEQRQPTQQQEAPVVNQTAQQESEVATTAATEEKVDADTSVNTTPDQTGNPVDAVQKAEEKDQNPAPQGNNEQRQPTQQQYNNNKNGKNGHKNNQNKQNGKGQQNVDNNKKSDDKSLEVPVEEV